MNDTPKNTSLLVSSEEQAALMKVRKTIFKYLSNFPLFLIFLTLALFFAYLYLKYTNPIYRATATLLLVKDDKSTGADKDLINALVSGRSEVNVQDEIELIKSMYLLNKVVEKNNLNVGIWQNGRIKGTELGVNNNPFIIKTSESPDRLKNILFVINYIDKGKFTINKAARTYSFYDTFNVSNTKLTIVPSGSFLPFKNTDYQASISNTRTAANNISNALKVTPKLSYSRVVELNYTGSNPAQTELVLQKIMEEYVQLGVEEKRKVQETTLKFIIERLAVLSGELGSVEGKLENFRCRFYIYYIICF